jgi:hypothetical protein
MSILSGSKRKNKSFGTHDRRNFQKSEVRTMKNKRLEFITAIFLLLVILSLMPVRAELSMHNSVALINKTSTNETIVRYHSFYQFDDTSSDGIGRWIAIPVFYNIDVEPLPYNLSYGEVDWCNFSVTHYRNNYDSSGNIINTTTDIESEFFGTNVSHAIAVNYQLMKARDSAEANMDCHYTDVRSLYEGNVLVGRFTTFFPSFVCSGCTQYTLEELSQQTAINENLTANQLGVYSNVQKVVNYNYQIWVIASWIAKIGFVFIAIGLIFLGIYYFYNLIKNIEQQI